MPQLDKLAFVSQVIWLVSIFMGMYFVLLKYSLPNLYKVLKFRKLALVNVRESIKAVDREIYLVNLVNTIVIKKLGSSLGKVGLVCFKIASLNVEQEFSKVKHQIAKERAIAIVGELNEENLGGVLSLGKSVDSNEYIDEVKAVLRKKIVEG